MTTALWITFAALLAAAVVLALATIIGFGMALGMRLEILAYKIYTYLRNRRYPVKETA